MKPLLIVSLAALIGTAGCNRGGENLSRDEQQYEVIQEGVAGGSTSTLVPAEAPGSLPPSTGTGVDTTTTFTLPNTPLPAGEQQPGSLAGTLPVPPPRVVRPTPVTPAPVPATPPPPVPAPVEPEPAPAEERPAESEQESEAEEQEDEPPPPPPGT